MKCIPLTAAFLSFATALVAQDPAQPLTVGDAIPEVTLHTDKGENFDLRQAVAEEPAVLIFYRGGWCPFCTRHLMALEGIQKDLVAAGFQLLAISADQPSKLREKPAFQALTYTLLSDSTMAAARAFGIAYKVPDDVLARMKSMGVDLEAASGNTGHLLPYPSVFIVDKAGIIRFAYVNPDYKVRLDPAKILEAARAVE